MKYHEFWEQLQARITRYDLLRHPFYLAWSAGALTREQLREYASDYYCHVAAFPAYLSALFARLDDGELRRAVLVNLSDEEGLDSGRPHSELWLDFAEGIGADREEVRRHAPRSAIVELIDFFHRVAREGQPEAALTAFYVYESQVPRVAKEKARWLRQIYGANRRTCAYFTLHTTADVYHANIWREHLTKRLHINNPHTEEVALAAGEGAAQALWKGLDGRMR
jgi:pyrroloquinoline-quinone synthase